MAQIKNEDIVCLRTECFSNNGEKCRVLNNTDFGKRRCPFFKTMEKYQRGLRK